MEAEDAKLLWRVFRSSTYVKIVQNSLQEPEYRYWGVRGLALLDSVLLILHVLLFALRVVVTILILRVHSLYPTMKINRTVMTPMLFVGLFIALQGITELTERFIGDLGRVAHATTVFLGVVFFLYGIYSYYKMLQKTAK